MLILKILIRQFYNHFNLIGTPAPGGMPPTSGYPTNPGTVEDLHKKCQNIFPMFFEGAKLLVNKALNSNFQVSHTMTMSNMQPSGYRFGATYVGQKMLSPQEAFPLLLADIDPSGNLNANIMHAPTENTRLKVRIFGYDVFNDIRIMQFHAIRINHQICMFFRQSLRLIKVNGYQHN